MKSASNTILSGEIAAFGTESICKKHLVIRQSFYLILFAVHFRRAINASDNSF